VDLEFSRKYGPWAVVTGASSGIGEGFARTLASRGIRPVLVARRKDELERVAASIDALHGVETRTVAMDLVRPEAAAELASAVADLEVGLLVNNAGTGWIGRFDKQPADAHAALIQLHCTLPIELTARLLPAMRERRRGAVILVSSVGAFVPMPYYSVYGGTKALLQSWGEALAEELADSGVDVLVLAPGDTKTGFQDVAGEMSTRWATVDQVVHAAVAALGRKRVVMPGLEDRAGIFLARFLPRRLVVRLVGARERAQTPEERR